MKLNLKEKIFNLLAQNFFGLNYNFSEAKDFNLTKELENNSGNIPYKKNSLSITSKVLDNNKIIKFSNDFNIYACGTEKFETSEKIGVWEYYYKNEIENKTLKKYRIIDYSKDKQSLFYPTGEEHIRVLENGTVETYYRSGELEKISRKTATEIVFEYSFFQNGKLKEKRAFYREHLIGEYELYKEDGILLKKAFYNTQGELEGFYQEFYSNSKLKIETFYINGKKIAFEKEFYENGQLRSCYLYSENKKIKLFGIFLDNGANI